MKFSAVFAALLTAGVVRAQFDNIPQCSVQCLVDALTKDGCGQLTDFACHCQKPGLVQTVTPCVEKACSAPERAAVASVVVEQCSKVGHPISIPPAGGAEGSVASGPTSGPAPTTTEAMSLVTASSAAPSSHGSSGHTGSSSHPASSVPGGGSASYMPSGSPTSHAPSATSSTLLATGAASLNKDNIVGVVVAAAAAVCMF